MFSSKVMGVELGQMAIQLIDGKTKDDCININVLFKKNKTEYCNNFKH